MVDSGDTVDLSGLARAQRRQALHRRRRRRGDAGVRAARRGARPGGREALRPRPRPHRRHARQAGVDPGPAHRPRAGGAGAPGRADRVRRRRAVGEPGAGRRQAVRAPRRDGDVAVDPADRGQRDVEEARRHDRPDPARREGGLRRVHEDAGGGRGAGAGVPRAGGRVGSGVHRARHGHVPAAGRRDRQRPRRRRGGPPAPRGGPGAAARPHGPAGAATRCARLEGLDAVVAIERAERAIDDGTALERFRRMVEAQGGDPRVADDPEAVLPARP